jgi:hypothetical protein
LYIGQIFSHFGFGCILLAISSSYWTHADAALKSKQGMFPIPNLRWTNMALAGVSISGEIAPRMIRLMLSRRSFASSMTRWAACIHQSEVASPSSVLRFSLIPAREKILPWVVPKMLPTSSFVDNRYGRYGPIPFWTKHYRFCFTASLWLYWRVLWLHCESQTSISVTSYMLASAAF